MDVLEIIVYLGPHAFKVSCSLQYSTFACVDRCELFNVIRSVHSFMAFETMNYFIALKSLLWGVFEFVLWNHTVGQCHLQKLYL